MSITSSLRTGADTAGDGAEPPGRFARLGRRRTLTMAVAGLVVLTLFAVWLVAFSSAFGARTIQVRGLHTLTAAEVDGRAAIARGTPLVRIDTATIASRVESLPEVASAQVSTEFPSTVVITVVERVAVGYLQSGGVYRLVDRTGDAYRAVVTRPHGLPLLTASTSASGRAARRAVAQVAAALGALPAASRPRVTSIEALAPDAITVVLTRNRVVQWGTSARSAAKARVLPILLRKGSRTTFNVSNPDQPYSS